MRIVVMPTSCECGGSYAWLVQRASGAWEMYGCICHSDPPYVGVPLRVDKERPHT